MAEQIFNEAVRSAFVSGGADVKPGSGDTLLFTLRNGSVMNGQAGIGERWLSVDVPLADARTLAQDGKLLWSRLLENGRLTGAVRHAVGLSGKGTLRADVPLDPADDLDRDVAAVCRDLKEAYGGCPAATAGSDGAPLTAGEMAERFAGSGWELTAKEPHIYATLDVHGRFVQARIESVGPNAFRASVPLLTVPSPMSGHCQHAVSLFLLSLSNHLRQVRPAADDGIEEVRIGCEAPFRSQADPSADLGRALSALSVAAAFSIQEVRALTHEHVGAAYLAVRAAEGGSKGKSNQRRR